MTAAPVDGAHDPHLSYTNKYCIICFQIVPLADAIAGSLYANGDQAFACDSHIENRAQWIAAWALFNTQQTAVTTLQLQLEHAR